MMSSDTQRGHDALFVQGREVKRVTKRGPVPKVGTGPAGKKKGTGKRIGKSKVEKANNQLNRRVK